MKYDAASKIAHAYLSWSDFYNRPKPKDRPVQPAGERILLRQAPDETHRVLAKHLDHQVKPFLGIIVGAGDQAAEKLYDAGYELGDDVWIGKYAGVQEEWLHMLKGHEGDPACDHDLIPVKATNDIAGSLARHCSKCEALQVREPMIVCMQADILGSEALQLRIEAGEVRRYMAVEMDAAGNPTTKTRYVTERVSRSAATSWDLNMTTTKMKAVK